MKEITSTTYPEAFAAMDEAAKAFWAYPNQDWQDAFLLQWAQAHGDRDLTASLLPF
jgi:hypothetical protein